MGCFRVYQKSHAKRGVGTKKEPSREERFLIKPQFSTLLLEHRTWAPVLSFGQISFAKGLKTSGDIDKVIDAFVFKY